MRLPQIVIKKIEQRLGAAVTTPSGSAVLRHDIESVTGVSLSLNTVKRLTGVIEYRGEPRPDTLVIVARYLGYGSWEEMLADMDGSVSQMGRIPGGVTVADLAEGARMEVTWSPGRRVVLCRQADGRCLVTLSERSKLQVGDVVALEAVMPGFPLLTSAVTRAGRPLGPYCAAMECGVTSVKIL